MEQVYRRRSEYGAARSRNAERSSFSGYKQAMIKQAVLCLFLFVAALLIKVYPQPELEAVQNSIQLILDTETDFAGIPDRIYQWVHTYILHEDMPEDVKGDEVLSNLAMPVHAPVSSGFGLRAHPVDGEEKFHYGVDLAAAEGEKIKCAAPGVAAEVGQSEAYGNYIVVQHKDDIYTLYAHCQTVLPQTGDVIGAEQVIATVGATGNATGPHLHFEIRSGDSWLDPAEFVSFPQDQP